MKIRTYRIGLDTTRAPEFIDITERVCEFIQDSQVLNGFAVVYSKHTTAAIKVNENEPLLLKDMEEFLERMASRNGDYRHNAFSVRTVNMTEDECPNGHAHCQHLLLGSSENIPIIDGQLQFGRWQRIFLIELDMPRPREVLVQVIKEGLGTKGPTLSTYISIPGRYLVLMPGLQRVGVSRKIEDEDIRRKLRSNLLELNPPKGIGFIIRTAGIDRAKRDLQRDLNYLIRLWRTIVRRIKKSPAPTDIYEESDMIIRTIRDIYNSEIDSIWIDEPSAYERCREFIKVVMPRHVNRVKLYEGKEALFHKYKIEEEIERIQHRHVPLRGGGSIVIDQTEALVAIDVNSGNFRADDNAEKTAFQVNLRAAEEISRQIRLRDVGGVIVNDFIDMRDERHRREVERTLRESVRRDRARTKVLRISPFGLIEMTRQRIRPSLRRSTYEDCPCCSSTGQVKTAESMAIEVIRNLMTTANRENVSQISVEIHERVADYLNNRKRKEITDLEAGSNVKIIISARTDVGQEHLKIQCTDKIGNEVKSKPL